MTLELCRYCQRYHAEHLLRCPETKKILKLEGRALDGRYRFCRRAGQSATSQVWQAEQLNTGRIVALKLLLPEWVDELGLLSRFENEARLLAKVCSERVVSILDRGHSELGPFLVTEWLPGETLQHRLEAEAEQGARWSVPMVLVLGRALAQAMLDMHRQGVVHRDLKPGNIMVQGHGLDLKIKVYDFGLAKALGRSGGTAQGVRLGTAQYMAPEQREDASRVDERADLFAWGVILVQVLSGESRPVDASAMDPTALASSGLVALLRECLASDPERRPASAKALFKRLSALEEVESPGGGKPRSKPGGGSSSSRGLWVGLGLGGVVGSGLVWALGGSGERCGQGPAPDLFSDAAFLEVSRPREAGCWEQASSESLETERPQGEAAVLKAGLVVKKKAHKGHRRVRIQGRERPLSIKSTGVASSSNWIGGSIFTAGRGIVQAPLDGLRKPARIIRPHQRPASPLPEHRSPLLVPAAELWALAERSSPMSFFDARQFCASLAEQAYQGLHSWRLAKPQEMPRWVHVSGIHRGWYWTDQLKRDRATVVVLPSNRHFYAKIRRRFIRPFCVADRR